MTPRDLNDIQRAVERELVEAERQETAAGEARRNPYGSVPVARREAEAIDEDAIKLEMERRLEKRFAR